MYIMQISVIRDKIKKKTGVSSQEECGLNEAWIFPQAYHIACKSTKKNPHPHDPCQVQPAVYLDHSVV
mgnify:CR=1 FL=1